MPLTDTAVRSAKPQTKPYKLSDGGGLYLEVMPNKSKYWRMKYRFGGKEKRLAFGVYPDVPLALARSRRDGAREILASGGDPGEARKMRKLADRDKSGSTFEAIARDWYIKRLPTLAPATAEKILRMFERDIFPWLGARPIADITPPELLHVLRRIEGRGAVESSHRAHQYSGQVFRYALAIGRVQRDPAADLRGALAPVKTTHRAAITEPAGFADLLRAIAGYTGSFVTGSALRLAPLLFVRPGELRQAEWAEIDLDRAEWRIPAAKMKTRADHIVPLPAQAVAVLSELHPLTSRSRFVFPSLRTAHRPMSENTVNAALRRLGFDKATMTGHGFRAAASTMLNEQGWNRDVIERQLAHAERNKVRAAYNRAEHLPERRKMMQAWADYLDALREDRKVVAGGFGRVA
ncbi:MAG: tyrosine-type recombinase/integrase [Nevskia sp.]|nr:tyrosine-type recombinase/integrase [Nevskia sp.]